MAIVVSLVIGGLVGICIGVILILIAQVMLTGKSNEDDSLFWKKFLFLHFKKFRVLSGWTMRSDNEPPFDHYDLNDKELEGDIKELGSRGFRKVIAYKGDDFIAVNEKYDYNIKGIGMNEEKIFHIIKNNIRTEDDLIVESI